MNTDNNPVARDFTIIAVYIVSASNLHKVVFFYFYYSHLMTWVPNSSSTWVYFSDNYPAHHYCHFLYNFIHKNRIAITLFIKVYRLSVYQLVIRPFQTKKSSKTLLLICYLNTTETTVFNVYTNYEQHHPKR